jgi:hypothetical protein
MNRCRAGNTWEDGPPMRAADRFQECQLCGGYVDVFDLAFDPRPRRPVAAPGARSSAIASQDHQCASVARANLAGAMALTHDGAALMILRRYCNGSHADGQELLVIKHRAEIAHVEPAFKEVKLNPLA